MIFLALLILAAAVLWRLLPEFRHLDEIERSYDTEERGHVAGG